MSEFLKPDNLNVVWASGGDRLFPGNTKYASGWGVEIPPRQYFNEIDYKQDQMLAHINQRGVVEWDADTEYQVDKSYIQGASGTIYRCILTHSGQNPDLDVANTYWEIAFANAGDFYTKTEGDTRYAQISNNGSDFVASTFRTNLNLYSKTETYSQSEVDAKTTIASTIQAQTFASNTTLMTPLRLKEAFQGDNQRLAQSGFQKLPGGVVIQWGVQNVPNGAAGTLYSLPIAFPAGSYSVVASHRGSTNGTVNVEAVPEGLAQIRLTHNLTNPVDVAYFIVGS